MNRKARDMQTARTIPCFKNAQTMRTKYLEKFVKLPNLTLLFVNILSVKYTLRTLARFVKD